VASFSGKGKRFALFYNEQLKRGDFGEGYRGLAKNATRSFTALALANIFLARVPLMAQVRP
jgi:hypothetical protein